MADVQPFRGLRYNVERAGDISSVISPPYDVISPEEQRLYHQQSPYNVVRLELGEDRPADSPQSNRYTRAADTFRKWLEGNILVRDQVPAFYVLEHRFMYRGALKSRWGLVARVRLEDQNAAGARPHEDVLESRVQDRLNLLSRCRVNVSSILGMVRQGQEGLASILSGLAVGGPDLTVTDHLGVIHRMWVIKDEQNMAKISIWCADKVVYIADGHHRYETALAYHRGRQAALSDLTGDEAHNFVMMTLADAGDPGTIALPAHRLLRLANPGKLAELKDNLSPIFDLSYLEPAGATPTEGFGTWSGVLEDHGRRGVAIGLYGLDGTRLCLLTPRERARLDTLLPRERSQEWKNLDVAFLHWFILGQIMGVDTPQKEEAQIAYTQDEQEAISRVDSGEYQIAFLMNPLPISSVLAVADAGDKMPPKSTYFYPKLPTGLVMYPLWDEEE